MNFTCDRCGRQLQAEQMKESFEPDGTKLELCPECLDEHMNESDEVRGGPGDKKVKAAYVDEAAKSAPTKTRKTSDADN